MPPTAVLTLQDAIHWVDAAARDADPLERLENASTLVQDLAELGDAALGYFIDQARHAGRSWSEIGDALGVTKQAAQQKHTVRLSFGPNTPTLDHLTPRARNVVTEAERIARSWGHAYIGTEHLLLALYREPKGIGAQVLANSGLRQQKAEPAVAERVQRGTVRTEGELSFTPRAVAAFSDALSSAIAMNHNYIGTEHLLLGLGRGDGVAAEVLRASGLSYEQLSQAVESKLAPFVAGDAPVKVPGKRTAAKTPRSKKAISGPKAQKR